MQLEFTRVHEGTHLHSLSQVVVAALQSDNFLLVPLILFRNLGLGHPFLNHFLFAASECLFYGGFVFGQSLIEPFQGGQFQLNAARIVLLIQQLLLNRMHLRREL